MKIFTILLLAFMSLQSLCPMQMGMNVMDHEKGPMTEQDCPTTHCISHENKTDDVLLSFNSPVLPAAPLAVQPVAVFPDPSFETPPFHAPPLLSPITKTIVLRI